MATGLTAFEEQALKYASHWPTHDVSEASSNLFCLTEHMHGRKRPKLIVIKDSVLDSSRVRCGLWPANRLPRFLRSFCCVERQLTLLCLTLCIELVESYCAAKGLPAVDWRKGNSGQNLSTIVTNLTKHGLRYVHTSQILAEFATLFVPS